MTREDLLSAIGEIDETMAMEADRERKVYRMRNKRLLAVAAAVLLFTCYTYDKDDEVVSMELAHKGEELLVVTRNGYGKRTAVKEYKLQARGGKGLLTYDKTKFDKTGELVGAMVVAEDDEIFLINSDGIIIRINASDVSRLGRTTQGIRMMKVDEDVQIVSMAKAIRENNDEDDAEEAPEEGGQEKAGDGTQLSIGSED